MSLRVARNNRRASFRAAVIVSRKVHKSAVRRNRIRRRIYEAVRLRSGTITAPYDLVFTVFSDQLANMPAMQLQALVERMLARARVIKMARPAYQPVRHDIVTRKED